MIGSQVQSRHDRVRGKSAGTVTVYYRWFLLIQSGGPAEHLIGLEPAFLLRDKRMRRSRVRPNPFHPATSAEYGRCLARSDTIRARCQDGRAALPSSSPMTMRMPTASSIAHPLCPGGTRFRWSGRRYAVAVEHTSRSTNLRTVDTRHSVAKEAPNETLARLTDFFDSNKEREIETARASRPRSARARPLLAHYEAPLIKTCAALAKEKRANGLRKR